MYDWEEGSTDWEGETLDVVARLGHVAAQGAEGDEGGWEVEVGGGGDQVGRVAGHLGSWGWIEGEWKELMESLGKHSEENIVFCVFWLGLS